ncbi:S-adenosyl-L-methionine-dependent methyltransferase [Gamsiella multidivaricata]|uniref:S-adenosyl-L-methionine-dependent methyltransferase n=1 Tax=Gamsiella multidivaricata TaxID=101098 RepID=UPI00221FA052|nr:S-adenosyl-L-methionine-dependent methyltransferase [Gamsiella multidivaricata]KAI7822332.1 S-adenosyl-L-methionine-dependent methyltransferase [Gamsiella multidivaricata]
MDLEILTRPPTLIPRWETEEWTARLATVLTSTPYFSHQTLHQPIHHSLQSSSPPSTSSSSSPSSSRFRILDICTGSGCIPLGLASALPPKSSHLIGIDIHEKAIQLATENETHNRALLRGNRVNFQRGDLMAPDAVDTFLRFSSPSQRQEQEQEQYHNNSSAATTTTRIPRATGYNLIISNPPYISHSEFSTLEPEVAQWEDPNALLADQEGLIFYPRIAHMAMSLLHSNTHAHHSSDEHNNSVSERQWRNGPDLDEVKVPELVFEIGGDHQVESVSKAAREAGFRRVQVWKDLADRSRCIIAAR